MFFSKSFKRQSSIILFSRSKEFTSSSFLGSVSNHSLLQLISRSHYLNARIFFFMAKQQEKRKFKKDYKDALKYIVNQEDILKEIEKTTLFNDENIKPS